MLGAAVIVTNPFYKKHILFITYTFLTWAVIQGKMAVWFMAKRGHTQDGKVVCSDCSSVIEKTASKCEHCAAPLTEDFDCLICPYCGSVLNTGVSHCTNCGLRFKPEEKTVVRSKEDEEFLSRLLEWGRKLEAKRETPDTDKAETEQASRVFKDVVGAPSTSLPTESLKELKRTVEERNVYEKREESILKLAEPLRKALDLRKRALNGAEKELTQIEVALGAVTQDDVASVKKRSEIERRRAEITIERGAIRTLEENIENMDKAYRSLLEQHSTELADKENNLNVRLEAFKSEMDRRQKEKDRLAGREEFLRKKEHELEARIQSLKDRENSLRVTEDKMKAEIQVLEEQREGVSELRKPAAELIASRGKWLVDEDELKSVLRKSKSARETWLTEQGKIQDSIASGEPVEQIERESEQRFEGREAELLVKIKDLEDRLAMSWEEDKKVIMEEMKLVADEKKLRKVLKVIDDLLGNLPDNIIDKFVLSKDYELYEKLMEEMGV